MHLKLSKPPPLPMKHRRWIESGGMLKPEIRTPSARASVERLERVLCVSVLIALLVLIVCMLSGCTVRPAIPESQTISFDGNEQTAGFLGWTNGMGIITESARSRFNALVLRYGTNFVPPLVIDQGLSQAPPLWLIDRESLVNFQTMSRWKRQGR